jgi:uncharacterized membrane protein SpoIIM required for sporulation
MSLRSGQVAQQNGSLKSVRFRQERETDWSELERLVNTYERAGVKGLSDDEILAAPILYRSTLSALSVARSTSLDSAVIDYLESLCARGYFFIYGSRATLWDKLGGFFRTEWRLAVCHIWKETLVSGLVMALGAALAIFLFGQSNEWYFTFVPGELAGGRDPGASTEYLRSTLYHNEGNDTDAFSTFATSLFTHNSRVALLAFAVGFAFGIPTALVIAFNGATLGMFIGLFMSRGLGFEVGGWLIIHGVTEMFAFILAGAAGLNLGRAMAFPGDQSRLSALAKAGVVSGTVMGGCVVMLFVAGLLEGFGRQMITSDLARYCVGGFSGLVWFAYFYAPRRTSSRAVL